MKTKLYIGDREIGEGLPAYIVAEIGINHNGDMQLATAAVDAAKAAGADAVKFQNYVTEEFLSDRTLTWRYVRDGKEFVEPQFDMFKRCELTDANLELLARHCAERGIDMHSTPTSEAGISTLRKLKVGVLKNGSDYLGNLDLVRAMGRTGLPTVLSTGMATLSDIEAAVEAFRSTGNDKLVLLHCTSSYPTPATHVNLRRLPTLQAAFACPVGFSDHTEGVTAAALSIAFGACWIEKHFTLDRTLPGPDHAMSSDPAEFAALVAAVRGAEAMLGSSAIFPAEVDPEARQWLRLSCVAGRDMQAGEIVHRADMVFRRPGNGFTPAEADLVAGLRLRKPVKRGQKLVKSHFVD